MLGRTDRRQRSVAVLGVICVFALVAVIRLAYWQVAMAPELQTRALGGLLHKESEHAVRGDILDRNGNVLATTGYRDTLAAYPDQISPAQREATVLGLTEVLRLDKAAAAALDAELSSKDSKYAVVRRELTDQQSRDVRAGIDAGKQVEDAPVKLYGLTLIPHLVRIYPNPGGEPGTTLASQLLGFVTATNGDSVGHYGIEQQYDAILAGRPKIVASAWDRDHQPLESTARVLDPGADGEDVTISIDLSLQLQLEKELYAAWVADKAQRVSGLIMDPGTGALLAWASVPGYDANDSGNVATIHPGLLQDPIVSEVYEPGSVMKMLTAASALENKVVTTRTTIVDSRVLRFSSGQMVRNADHQSMGKIPFRDVIAYSRNVAVSKVAARLGRTTARASSALYKTWHKLGVGVPSGVDISGEVAGIAPDPRRTQWAPIDLANRSFGQGVATTPIQLATAFTPMINGGLRVQPHFLVAIGGRAQDVASPHRVLTKKVARQLQGLMHHVTSAVWWYAKGSLIPRWQVGGKTGTAQIWRSDLGRYDKKTFNFTFVGYVGGDAPAAVVAVHINEAKPEIRGQGDFKLNITSYQLFRKVALGIIRTQDVPKSRDPAAGQPEPGSDAERVLEPARYLRRTHAAVHAR